ncbi:MAG: peptidoglycan binding protein CsiV [Chromatiales bacterium]|jgi:hypothetical protein|nr:peptidoglycan binding protein CsiV [Chromatiales bacterium]
MMHFPITFILLAIGALAAATTAAAATEEDPWYEVEVIVFEHVGARSGPDSSKFETRAFPQGITLSPALPITNDVAPSPDATPTESSRLAFQKLANSQLRLQNAMQRLKVTPRYRPLLHTGWRQPATTAAGFPGVQLSSDKGDGAMPVTLPGETQDLEGIIRLSRGRFLNLSVDLRLRQPGEPTRSFFGHQTEPDRIYRLQQTRRARSGELQYFDHPRFGAIVLITPYELKTARTTGPTQP